MGVFERQHVKVEIAPSVRQPDLTSVRVDDEGLWFDGSLVVQRADIVSVSLELDERSTVHVRSKRGQRYSCTFTARGEAHALIEALGRTPERTRLEVDLEPFLPTSAVKGIPLWKAILLLLRATVAIAISLSLSSRDLRHARPTAADRHARKLSVGADGILVQMGFVDDFLPYGEIASASARNDAIVLTRRDGREVVLRPTVGARTPEVLARIERELAASGAPVDAEAAACLRDVSGTRKQRLVALRELGTKAGSYREARVPRERLWDVVENPSAGGVMRTRAAVALSAALPSGERDRLRVAVDASVSPKVRVALDALERDDEHHLARTLDDADALSEEEERERRARAE